MGMNPGHGSFTAFSAGQKCRPAFKIGLDGSLSSRDTPQKARVGRNMLRSREEDGA